MFGVSVPADKAEQAMRRLRVDAERHGYSAWWAWLDRGGKRYHWVANTQSSLAQERGAAMREAIRARGLDAILEGWLLYATEPDAPAVIVALRAIPELASALTFRAPANEPEWLACPEANSLLNALEGRASARKLRLFAAACCRRIWPLFADDRSRAAVEVAERYADGLAGDEERALARAAAHDAWQLAGHSDGGQGTGNGQSQTTEPPAREAAAAALGAVEKDGEWQVRCAFQWVEGAANAIGQSPDGPKAEGVAQVALVRDLFGNPFRPTATAGPWQSATVISLALAVYEERCMPSGELDTNRLAILADALEEAGCTEDVLLSHLRGPGPHARGCFALDLLLGRT
jgi:hypothetical protein